MDLKEGLVYGNSHTIKEANLLEFPLDRNLSRKYITRNRRAVYATEILADKCYTNRQALFSLFSNHNYIICVLAHILNDKKPGMASRSFLSDSNCQTIFIFLFFNVNLIFSWEHVLRNDWFCGHSQSVFNHNFIVKVKKKGFLYSPF